MTMVFFLVLITLVVGSIDETVTSNIFLDNINEQSRAPGLLQILGTIWNYLSIFYRIMFFQVEGIPGIFNYIIFYPLTAGTLFMLIDIIRGNG
jgi:hypothetical protein